MVVEQLSVIQVKIGADTLKSFNPDCFVLGRSYCVCSPRMLNQCLESLVQKVQSGVVINFEKAGPDPSPIDGTCNFLHCVIK